MLLLLLLLLLCVALRCWRGRAGGRAQTGDDASRDERRFVAAKNKKAREERKRKELVRVRRLVEQANAIDPRVRAHEEEIEREKARKIQGMWVGPCAVRVAR